ncbi:uncharacterized protein si:ch211-40k21.5 [Danio aesculapii]|uniref:uncharacterized protein si:ch211-40k21.5 n=1 Tax=Danio aesculapii TaxID=1142201 RepID=UPI0024BFD7E6|nr:uncharacterized protein si:ch211-40k21.5 [Danio aesculapii]
MEAAEQKGSETEYPKKPRHPAKLKYNKRSNKGRINIRDEIKRWKQLKREKGFKSNAELATYLLDRAYSDLSEDRSSISSSSPISIPPRGRTQKSMGPALQTEATWMDTLSSDQLSDSADLESGPNRVLKVEVLEFGFEHSPYQTIKQEEPEQQTEDESGLDIMIASTAESYGFIPHCSSSTDDENEMQWGEIKDELAETAQRLEERLEAMRSLSVRAPEPPSATREKDKEVKWINKSSLTTLFRTCHQCGEPVLEFKTLTSGSLSWIQWECSKGHLMWLFHNYNTT